MTKSEPQTDEEIMLSEFCFEDPTVYTASEIQQMLNTMNDVQGLLPCGDNENGLPYSVSCWKIKCNTDKDSAIREDLITNRYN